MAGRDFWMSLAEKADTDDVRENILAGYKEGKPFTPYVPTIPIPEALDSVLDFGCGLGRNFPYLTQIARAVAGFDLPPMIDRCRAVAGGAVDLLSSDWNRVRQLRFELIFTTLVLQHIEPHPARAFLGDFSHMAPSVYLLTRTNTDFGENLLAIVADLALFDIGECVEVDHDPDTHQLKVVARMPFEEARQLGPGRHIEVMLRARRAHPASGALGTAG
jgi:SAM-dependent methyltransferase